MLLEIEKKTFAHVEDDLVCVSLNCPSFGFLWLYLFGRKLICGQRQATSYPYEIPIANNVVGDLRPGIFQIDCLLC